MSISSYETGPFRVTADMENVLATISDLAKGLAFIAETMEPSVGTVIQRMAWLITEQCKDAENMRCDLWKLVHPDQERLNREGWPQ